MSAASDPQGSVARFHAGQFVRVRVSGAKHEIGHIEVLEAATATVATSSGFSITRALEALVPASLVVLDLNGVLGYRKTKAQFHPRPFVQDLLHYLFRHFVVGVWTSCTEQNGTAIIRQLFGPELESRLVFRMFRNECTPNPTPDNPYGTVKDLRRIWERYPFFNARNTIIVDDSDDKCSHRHCALCPVPFTKELASQNRPDKGLEEVVTVLDRVLEAGSIEPIRDHMLQRFAEEEAFDGDLRATSNSGRQSEPTTPHNRGNGPSPCSARPYEVGGGPFGSPSCASPARLSPGTLLGIASADGAPHRPMLPTSTAMRVISQQDAYDSDEERERPSVGNTPIMPAACTTGAASTLPSPLEASGRAGASPPPSTHHSAANTVASVRQRMLDIAKQRANRR